jgi:hypothetical protein
MVIFDCWLTVSHYEHVIAQVKRVDVLTTRQPDARGLRIAQ